MAGSITQCLPNSFLSELLTGTHNFTNGTGDTFKLALFKSAITGTYNSSTTNYSNMTSNSDEVPNGSGYTTGGVTLTNVTPVISGTTAYASFGTATWPTSSFSSIGGLIYNSSKANRIVALLAFGSVITSSSSTFTVTFPAAGASTAIIRVTYG